MTQRPNDEKELNKDNAWLKTLATNAGPPPAVKNKRRKKQPTNLLVSSKQRRIFTNGE